MQKNEVGIPFVLSQLQENLSRQEARLTEHMQATAAQGAVLNEVSSKVEHLTKTVTTGNGQPALIVQMRDLNNDVKNFGRTLENLEGTAERMQGSLKELSDTVKALKERMDTKYSPQKTEKLKAWGVLVTSAISLVTAVTALISTNF